MNIERLKILADVVEGGLPEITFNMQEWLSEGGCGTVACIAGFAWMVMPQAEMEAIDAEGVSDIAAAWLGLDEETANALFVPISEKDVFSWMSYAQISRGMAARSIRILVETGKVDWKRARREHIAAFQAARKLENA